jgi:exonuclease III
MINVSYNIRGVGGGSPKFLALKIYFKKIRPDVVLIQEMMCEDFKACEVFLKIFPGWEVYSIGP